MLHLYPKNHIREYGEQMVQTFDDLLSEDDGKQHAFAIWFRIGRELPLNIIEEHTNNLKGVNMDNIKSNKRVLVIGGAVALLTIGIGTSFVLRNNAEFSPTTLSKVQHSGEKPACSEAAPASNSPVATEDETNINNAVTTSIIDVPAGTQVDTYFKSASNDSKTRTGTAIYSGSYGKYNFTAKKNAQDSNDFSGGWKITNFEACE
jgi:hypothetical protein